MKLFGLASTREYAGGIARALGVPLAACEERDFEDTEFKIRPLESVRDQHAVVCQSLYSDARHSASDKLCRLLFFAGALRDAGAARVTAVVPYLAFARKDRRTKARDPITSRYVAQLFEAMSVDTIVTADVHNPAAFENAFRGQKELVTAAPLFVAHFLSCAADAERVVVVSPDAGGVKRARAFADLLSVSLAQPVELGFLEKYRSEGRVSGELFAGDVMGATVIVLDDLISGGTTMARAARACVQRGARAVHAAATHAVFSANATGNLAIPELASVVVTDTAGAAHERCPTLGAKLIELPSATLFAEALGRIVPAA